MDPQDIEDLIDEAIKEPGWEVEIDPEEDARGVSLAAGEVHTYVALRQMRSVYRGKLYVVDHAVVTSLLAAMISAVLVTAASIWAPHWIALAAAIPCFCIAAGWLLIDVINRLAQRNVATIVDRRLRAYRLVVVPPAPEEPDEA
jgi:hypothetical protein